MVFIVLYKLSVRYYEIVKNVGTIEDDRKEDDTVNDTVNLSQLTERQRKIYEAIKNVPFYDIFYAIFDDIAISNHVRISGTLFIDKVRMARNINH